MMDFQQFALSNGLLIDHVVTGRIERCPTSSHAHKKNGAYFFEEDWGWVQDWAVHQELVIWKSENIVDQAALQRRIDESNRKHAKERQNRAQAASKKAGWILHQTKMETHAYLDSKGFPELLGMIYRPNEENNLLVIPMRIGERLVGCQLIDRDGNKKFLYGQVTKGAEYVIDNHGRDWFCEGYATGLSLREVLHALKIRYRIHICFSAHNMASMASHSVNSIVVADNDVSKAGEVAAISSGRPYLMSDEIGDLNDWHRRLGVFRLSQHVRSWLKSL